MSTQPFLYRLHELDLISGQMKDRLDDRIKEFYESTGFKEPDSTRRCLTPNGRFFDLLLTAENIEDAKKEITEIKQLNSPLSYPSVPPQKKRGDLKVEFLLLRRGNY